jgi:hypothetical protein
MDCAERMLEFVINKEIPNNKALIFFCMKDYSLGDGL